MKPFGRADEWARQVEIGEDRDITVDLRYAAV